MGLTEEKDWQGAEVSDEGNLQPAGRLSCRGCTTRCGLYKTCNGRLWRMSGLIGVDNAAGAVETGSRRIGAVLRTLCVSASVEEGYQFALLQRWLS